MQAQTHWLSNNPDKAWVEKFFLIYSPIWMALMAMMMLTGWVKTFSNTALIIHSIIVAIPIVLVPLLFQPKQAGKAWYEHYSVKANLYLFIFGFWGNYFGSEYFFDVLGMVYKFPNATTNLDSSLVGSGKQPVPLIMYFYTHAYFMTYHVTANIALRKINQVTPVNNAMGQAALFIVAVFVVGYVWAWLETTAMANPLMESMFYYENMPLMLAYGSAIYATYFIASFPIYYFIDENNKAPSQLIHVVLGALAASMLTQFMLDAVGHFTSLM